MEYISHNFKRYITTSYQSSLTFAIFCFIIMLPLSVISTPLLASEEHFDDLYKWLNRARCSDSQVKPNIKKTKPYPRSSINAHGHQRRTRTPHNQRGKIDLHALIENASKSAGIPPSLLALIIDIESAGNPCAVSKAGAKGLCQLMPATWKALGVKDPFDPYQNVMAGAQLLRQLLDTTGGKLLESATSYNAGPKTLRKEWGNFPEETKNYLEIVVARYHKYAHGGWKKQLPRYVTRASAQSCRLFH